MENGAGNSGAIPTNTFSQVAENYKKAKGWLANLGLNVKTGRIAEYEKVIDFLKENYRTASVEDGQEIYRDFLNAANEIVEITKIYQAFKDVPHDQLNSIKRKLREGISGPVHAEEETNDSTQSRNIMFEVSTQANFHRPEKLIRCVFEEESDVAFKFERNLFYIECKHPFFSGDEKGNRDKVRRNVKKACSQLMVNLKRRNNSGGSVNSKRGMVALDISKMVHAGGQKILKCATDKELNDTYDTKADEFIEIYRDAWEDLFERKNSRIIGMLLRYTTMAESQESGLVQISCWKFVPRQQIKPKDLRLIRAITKAIDR